MPVLGETKIIPEYLEKTYQKLHSAFKDLLRERKGQKGGQKKVKWVKTLFWMMVFIFAILFSIQNKDEVILRFGLYPMRNDLWLEVPRVPLFLVILCSIFLGVLIGGIGDLYRRFQLKKTLRQNQKTIERLEREIESLRGHGLDQPSFLKKDS